MFLYPGGWGGGGGSSYKLVVVGREDKKLQSHITLAEHLMRNN